jgi:S1-C subfamily serine protease
MTFRSLLRLLAGLFGSWALTTGLLSACVFSPAFAAEIPPEVALRQQELLGPTVMVIATPKKGKGRSKGSGTVIYSRAWNGFCSTYILTNEHIVDNVSKVKVIASITDKWGERIGSWHRPARLVVADKELDLALIELDSTSKCAPYVAKLLPEGERIWTGQEAFAVGGPASFPPMISSGQIGMLRADIVTTVPIFSGNSGGGLYVLFDGHYHMVGVPSAIVKACCQEGLIPTPFAVPTISMAVKLSDAREWLRKVGRGYLLESDPVHVASAP